MSDSRATDPYQDDPTKRPDIKIATLKIDFDEAAGILEGQTDFSAQAGPASRGVRFCYNILGSKVEIYIEKPAGIETGDRAPDKSLDVYISAHDICNLLVRGIRAITGKLRKDLLLKKEGIEVRDKEDILRSAINRMRTPPSTAPVLGL